MSLLKETSNANQNSIHPYSLTHGDIESLHSQTVNLNFQFSKISKIPKIPIFQFSNFPKINKIFMTRKKQESETSNFKLRTSHFALRTLHCALSRTVIGVLLFLRTVLDFSLYLLV